MGDTEQGRVFLILKDYSSPKKTIQLKAGDILREEPRIMDRRDYIVYDSHNHMMKEVLEDMYNLSKTRNDIDFRNFKMVPIQHQIKFNKWSEGNNYNQAYINRIVMDRDFVVGVMIVTRHGLFSYREEVPYSKNIDNLVIVAYHKMLGYLRDRQSLDIDIIHVGFEIPEHEIPHDNVVYYTPSKHSSTNPQLFQMFNHYLITGEKLIPLIEVKM